MLRVLIGLAIIAGVVAFVMSRMVDEGVNTGPTSSPVDANPPVVPFGGGYPN